MLKIAEWNKLLVMENVTYEMANFYMAQSNHLWNANQIALSWQNSLNARICYLADIVVNVALFPFAILAVTFGSFYALINWDWKGRVFVTTYNNIKERGNHLLLSAFGAAVSPGLAHKYRDINLAPYVIAIRIAFIAGFLFYLGKEAWS